MKKYAVICSLILLTAVLAASAGPIASFAWSTKNYPQALTADPRLAEPNDLYKEAVWFNELGEGAHEPQRAEKHYADAEADLRRAVFLLKELGFQYSIDVSKEIEYCEQFERETHSKQGMARRQYK